MLCCDWRTEIWARLRRNQCWHRIMQQNFIHRVRFAFPVYFLFHFFFLFKVAFISGFLVRFTSQTTTMAQKWTESTATEDEGKKFADPFQWLGKHKSVNVNAQQFNVYCLCVNKVVLRDFFFFFFGLPFVCRIQSQRMNPVCRRVARK